MPIPDYQTVMLPLLQLLSDRKEYVFKDVVFSLGKKFKLTDQELNELLPSSQSLLFANRVGWARTYMKKAGLNSSKNETVAVWMF